MKYFSFNTIVIVLASIGFVILSSCGLKSQKPNFLIFLIDDLGSQDVACCGQEYIEAYNIDHLASQGMKWANAYSSCPVCSPTWVALLTGKNHARVHCTGHITRIGRHRCPEHSRIIHPGDLMDIPIEEVIISKALRPAGYTSLCIGKWHVGRKGCWPTEQGFDENVAGWTHGMPTSHFYPYENPDEPWNGAILTMVGLKHGEYLTNRLTDEAMKFIRRNKNKPFFAYLSYYAVHTPLQAPKELLEKHKSRVEGTGIDPLYAAMVESVNLNIGRVLQLLDELELQENTVVIFTSDNGALKSVTDNSSFPRGKGHLYEGLLRVPFIMRWPEHIEPGSLCYIPTISSDIYAAIVDIVGDNASPVSPLDGRSLKHDFKGETSDTTCDLNWYYPHYAPQGNRPGVAISSGDFKLIEFYDPAAVELYNLPHDIGETCNLSDSLSDLKAIFSMNCMSGQQYKSYKT